MAVARNLSIDVVRGLAILIMLPANMAAVVYAEPHAGWFRVLSSFAAPTFVSITGMMIAFGSAANKYDWRHYFIRGLLLLGVAACVDMLIWRFIPFYSYDVLYLIGIACPLSYFFTKTGRNVQLTLLGIIFLATPLLQNIFGYTDYPSEIYLWGPDAGRFSIEARNPTPVLQHLLIDGWFPLFPWLGISFSGAFIARYFFMSDQGEAYLPIGIAAPALITTGSVVWTLYPGEHYIRAGYSEMFYPSTFGFILTSIGFLLAALRLTHWNPGAWIYAPLRWLGEASLFIYVLHYSIIHFVLESRFPDKPFFEFMVINFVTLLFLIIVAWCLHQMKQVWPCRPFLIRFLLGG
ncbi:MAG: heparan-alpha-glucosaminide N-acetyltransferase domain-containing protein [Candidatus Manganitrophaceae bacterium]